MPNFSNDGSNRILDADKKATTRSSALIDKAEKGLEISAILERTKRQRITRNNYWETRRRTNKNGFNTKKT